MQYDVLIVGAGIVGLALANALVGSPLSVAVIERQPPLLSWPIESQDDRVSAITPGSVQAFKRFGVWSSIQTLGVSPYEEMHVWDALGTGSITFSADEMAEANLGYIIENRVMVRALWQRLQEQQVPLITPCQLSRYHVDELCAYLETADGDSLTTSLIVAADGARSWLREKAGIACDVHSYEQVAIVATVKTTKTHEKTAWQRFLPTGPVAFLPLWDPQQCSIVWSTTPTDAMRLMELDAAVFCENLTIALDKRLGQVTQVERRTTFPLTRQHATQYVASRVALVGDSAHTWHPLAGQGVNYGILDALALVDVLLAAKSRGLDISHPRVLAKYQRWRRSQNAAMSALVTGLKHLFSNDTPGLVSVRNWGLNGVNRMGLLKRYLARQAMGV